MSILIPGFSIPPKGTVRTLVLFDDGMLIDNADGQNQWQAIELPPHGRLIDADALLEDHGLGTYCPDCKRDARLCQYEMIHTTMDFCGWIEDAPTIVPADGGADG